MFWKMLTLIRKTSVKVTIDMKILHDPTLSTETLPSTLSLKPITEVWLLNKVLRPFSETVGLCWHTIRPFDAVYAGELDDNSIYNGPA